VRRRKINKISILLSLLLVFLTVVTTSCHRSEMRDMVSEHLEWPAYLHDSKNSATVDIETGLPEKIVWRKRYQAKGSEWPISNVIIYHGNVLVYTADGFIRALDVDSGTEDWKVGGFEMPLNMAFSGTRGKIVGFGLFLFSLSIDGGSLYYPTIKEDLQKKNIPREPPTPIMASTPITPAGNRIYFASVDKLLYSISTANWRVIWKAEMVGGTGQPQQAPCVANGMVFVPTLDRIYCFNKDNGNTLWTKPFAIDSSIVFSENRIYCGSTSGTVFCLDPLDGSVIWSRELSGGILKAPLVLKDRVIVSAGPVYCLRKDNGEPLWQNDRLGEAWTPLAATRSFCLFGDGNGNIYFINQKSGDVMKTFNIPEHPFTVALNKDRVVIGTERGYLFCFGR